MLDSFLDTTFMCFLLFSTPLIRGQTPSVRATVHGIGVVRSLRLAASIDQCEIKIQKIPTILRVFNEKLFSSSTVATYTLGVSFGESHCIEPPQFLEG